MKTTDLAYSAGLFDGEGSVKLHRNKVDGKSYYHVRVSVTNTEKSLLLFLRKSFGGHVSKGSKRAKKTHKQVWKWEASCRIAVAFLTAILPFMREPEKVRRARLSLKIAETKLGARASLILEFGGKQRVSP